MLTRGVIRIFKLHLSMCNSLGCISHNWTKNAGPGRLRTYPKSSKRRVQFYVNLGAGLAHNVFLIWSFFLQDIRSYGIAYQMLAIYFAGGYTLCNGLRVIVWIQETDIVSLINAQLKLEDFFKGYWDLEIKKYKGGQRTEKILLTLGIVTGISVPAFVLLILLTHPCLPPFIGSLLFVYKNNKCSWNTGPSSWTLYAVISVFDFWTHLDMVLPMTFSMFSLFALSIACLQDDIDFVNQRTSGAPGICLRMYRKLQILETQVNVCFRHSYFPLFLSGMTALLVFCMHSCVKLPGKIPMPGFSYFPLVVVNGIVSLLVMNTKAANVYEHSLKLITNLKCPPENASSVSSMFRRRHWVIKMAESLRPLKVHFGMNFVDKVTPLLMINFSVNQVVSLLLIQSE